MWVFNYLLTCTCNQVLRYSESPYSLHQWSNHIHTDCLKKGITWFSLFFLFCPIISHCNIPVQAHSCPWHFFIFLQSAALWHSHAFSSQTPYLQKQVPGLLLKYVLLLICAWFGLVVFLPTGAVCVTFTLPPQGMRHNYSGTCTKVTNTPSIINILTFCMGFTVTSETASVLFI